MQAVYESSWIALRTRFSRIVNRYGWYGHNLIRLRGRGDASIRRISSSRTTPAEISYNQNRFDRFAIRIDADQGRLYPQGRDPINPEQPALVADPESTAGSGPVPAHRTATFAFRPSRRDTLTENHPLGDSRYNEAIIIGALGAWRPSPSARHLPDVKQRRNASGITSRPFAVWRANRRRASPSTVNTTG